MKFTYIILFISILLLLLLLIDIHFHKNVIRIIKEKWPGSKSRKYIWIIVAFVFVITAIQTTSQLTGLAAGSFAEWLSLFSWIWYLPKMFLSPFLISKDIIAFIRKKVNSGKTSYSITKKTESDLKRRKFVQNTGIVLSSLPFIAVIDGALRTTNNYRVHTAEINLSKLPSNLNGLRIVQISDLHAGSLISEKSIVELAFIIDSLKPNIIVNTGDFVNSSPDEFEKISALLGSLRSTHGSYACLGNHDHYMTNAEHNLLIGKIREKGINLLINQNHTIDIAGDKIQIAGIDNSSYNSKFGDLDKTAEGLLDYLPTILLCHDPNEWDDIRRQSSLFDLTLSGHTHGGQIGYEFSGKSFAISSLINKYDAGLYRHSEQYLYVNRGIGTVGPALRIGIPPEVTLITLLSNEKYA